MEEQEGHTAKKPYITRPLIKEWSVDDDLNLFDQIRNILPENDHLNFYKRIELLNWAKVQFKNYSSLDCRKRFISVLTNLRTHKVLSEILKDAATSLDDQQEIILPEKPVEACLLYFVENKDELLKQNPQLNPSTKEMNVISDVFESLDCEQKAVYMERAAKAKEEFQLKWMDLINLPVKSGVARSELFRTMLLSLDKEEFFGKIIPNKPPGPTKLYFNEHKDELLDQNPLLSFEEGGKEIVKKRFLMNAELETIFYNRTAIAMEEYRLKLKQQMEKYPDHTTIIGFTLKKKAEEFEKYEAPEIKHPEITSVDAQTLYFLKQKDEVLQQNKLDAEQKAVFTEKTSKSKQKDVVLQTNKLDAEQTAVFKEKTSKSKEEFWLKLEQFLKINPEYYRVPGLLEDINKMPQRSLSVAIEPPAKAKSLFLEEYKDKLLKQNPQLAIGDLNKIIMGRPKFKSLNDKEKAKYVEKAAKAKIEHNLKIQSCLMKDIPNFPNKPVTPGMLYYKDHKDKLSTQNPQLSDEDLRKYSKERFISLEAEEKSMYMENFRKNNVQYCLKLQELKKDYPAHAVEIDRRLKEVTKVPKSTKVPSPRKLYYMEHRAAFLKQNSKQLPNMDVRKILYERFLTLNAEQKAVYEEKYVKSTEEYRLKWEKFMEDYPWYDCRALRPKPKEIKQSKSISAAMKRQSDPTMKNVAPPVKLGTKRPATEDKSVEFNQKMKKRRSEFVKMQNSSELQPVAKAESDGLKLQMKKKSSAVISSENKKSNVQAIEPPTKAKNLYYEELKDDLLKQNPQLAIDNLNKILMDRPKFESLKDNEKAKYAEKAAKAKIERDLKIQSCLMKDIPNFPNKPEDPFMLYYKDHKDEFSIQNPQLNDEDLRKYSKEQFNKLKNGKKSIYKKNFRQSNAQYYLKLQELMKDYPAHAVEIGHLLKVGIDLLGLPKKHPNAKELYYMEHKAAFLKQNNEKLSNKDVRKILNQRFLTLNAEQKAVYMDKYLKSAEEYRLKWDKTLKDYPGISHKSLLPMLKEIRQSKRISATMKRQSDPTMKNVAPPVKVGTKRPATEDKSGEFNQKNKKRRSAFEKMQNSSELQPVAKAKPDGLKQKKKKKKPSEGKVLNSSAKSGGLKQEKRKKKKSSAKKVVATIVAKVEQKASKKSGGLKEKKKKKKPVQTPELLRSIK